MPWKQTMGVRCNTGSPGCSVGSFRILQGSSTPEDVPCIGVGWLDIVVPGHPFLALHGAAHCCIPAETHPVAVATAITTSGFLYGAALLSACDATVPPSPAFGDDRCRC